MDKRDVPWRRSGLRSPEPVIEQFRCPETLPPWQGIGNLSSFKMEYFQAKKTFFPLWGEALPDLVKPPFASLSFQAAHSSPNINSEIVSHLPSQFANLKLGT